MKKELKYNFTVGEEYVVYFSSDYNIRSRKYTFRHEGVISETPLCYFLATNPFHPNLYVLPSEIGVYYTIVPTKFKCKNLVMEL